MASPTLQARHCGSPKGKMCPFDTILYQPMFNIYCQNIQLLKEMRLGSPNFKENLSV
jgi:hypothetical protein